MNSNPILHEGVWKPWRKSQKQLLQEGLSTIEIEKYTFETDKIYNFVEKDKNLKTKFKTKLVAQMAELNKKVILKSSLKFEDSLMEFDNTLIRSQITDGKQNFGDFTQSVKYAKAMMRNLKRNEAEIRKKYNLRT